MRRYKKIWRLPAKECTIKCNGDASWLTKPAWCHVLCHSMRQVPCHKWTCSNVNAPCISQTLSEIMSCQPLRTTTQFFHVGTFGCCKISASGIVIVQVASSHIIGVARFATWSLFAPMDILVAMLLVAYVLGLLTTTILQCAFRDRSQQKQDGSLKPELEPLLLEKNTVTEAKPEIDATQIYVCLHGKVFHTDMNCRHVKGRLRPVDVFRQCKHCKLSMNKWFCIS